MTDRRGIPLAVAVTAANVHDVVAYRAAYLLQVVRCGPGYDTAGVQQALRELADRFTGRR